MTTSATARLPSGPAIVNGAAGVVVAPEGRPFAVVGFTVADGRIVEIDLVADPEKLRRLA